MVHFHRELGTLQKCYHAFSEKLFFTSLWQMCKFAQITKLL